MRFVERLRPYSVVGTVIPCPSMTLEAGDHEPPVMEGAGEIVVQSATNFGFRLRGIPDDLGHAMRTLNRRRHDPYDGLLRERLRVTTQDGTVLHCGWTEPKVQVADTDRVWTIDGNFEDLTILEPGPCRPGTDAVFLLPAHHIGRIILRRFFGPEDADGRANHTMTVLGVEVTFALDDTAHLLTISAPGTPALIAGLAENWFGEPLRILFGQLVFPRYVSRAIGIQTMNCIRPTPKWSDASNACALWQGERSLIDREQFWESYGRLLAYIAAARDENGHPNFEANKITELYGEVIQAAHGSRWVWALTYASAAEGLIEIIYPDRKLRPDMAATEIEDLRAAIGRFKQHIDLWTGDPRLKEPAKAAASRMLEATARIGLRQLRDTGWVTPDQFTAWDKLRNHVMHGKLVSPYSSEEDDKLLLDLSGLLHALTKRIIAGVDPSTGAFAPSSSAPAGLGPGPGPGV